METLKELMATGQVVMEDALRESLTMMKDYTDGQDGENAERISDVEDAMPSLADETEIRHIVTKYNNDHAEK